MAVNPYSAGASAQLSDEDEKEIQKLPPALQQVARVGRQQMLAGNLPKEAHPVLAAQGAKVLAAAAAGGTPSGEPQAGGNSPVSTPTPNSTPATAGPTGSPAPGARPAPPMASPYGVRGGQIGPETEDQAINEKLAAQKAQQAKSNLEQVQAQQGDTTPAAAALSRLTPVTPGSGLSEHDKLVQDFKKNLSDTRPQGMSPEEFKSQSESVMSTPAFKSAQEGLDAQENYLKMALQKPQAGLTGNLGPMLAFLDARNGSNMAGAYKAPETDQAYRARILAAMQNLTKDRTALATNVIQGIKASKGGTLGESGFYGGNQATGQAAEDPMAKMARVNAANQRSFMTQYGADMKELNEANTNNRQAQQMLASANPVLDKVAIDGILKSAIGGRLSNYDIQRQGQGDPSWADRVENAISIASNGTMINKNRAEYMDALRVIQEANRREAILRQADWQKAGVEGLGIDPDRVQGLLNVGHVPSFAPLPQSTKNASRAKTLQAVPELYDGSTKPPQGATRDMLQKRFEWIKANPGAK